MTTRLEQQPEELALGGLAHAENWAGNVNPPPTPTRSLNPIEAAYITLAENELRAASMNAQQLFNARLAVVWAAKAVPDGAKVTIHRMADGAPVSLSWEANVSQ